jgi:8-oxo-dGTP diphosphatase
MSVPQFGTAEPGRDYPDRPAAFAVVERAGRIAVVQVDGRDGRQRLDLPGGGIDPGETPAQAAAREIGEEAGLKVRMGEPFLKADHYFVNDEGRSNNTRGVFLVATFDADAPELKVEDDHSLEWMDPIEALKVLSRDAHAWAVAVWLRERA